MDYVYSPVKTNEEQRNKIVWKCLLRQIIIVSGPWNMFFVTGMCLGTPTVMIPQLKKEANSTEAISDDMASWITSVFGYGTIPWGFILPILSEIYGRKLPFVITTIVTMFGFTTWYLSTTVTSVLIAEIVVSILISNNMTVCMVIAGEYASPRYRGVYLTVKSASLFWGIWVANAIGTFYHWKNIMIFCLICTAYNLLSFFWPESPHWLAAQGRFEDCAASHRLLMGTSQQSEHELHQLIMSQKNHIRDRPASSLFSRERFVNFIKTFSYKVVYKPILLSFVTTAMFYLSGKLVCSMYAIEILEKITGEESAAYKGMLILDAVTLLGMYFGCYVSKILKRRTLLISATSCSILFLFTFSIYLYLIKLSYISENNILSIGLLTLFSISINCGPMLLASSLFAELIPLRYKGSAVLAISLFNSTMFTTVLKLGPFIFKAAGLHGGFLYYGICTSICLLILYKYLPETHNKTLIEIEEHFRK